ncbi:DNA-3-methyladenine glycosylase [Halobaculum sp. MBLA0147]|uniref:DNA-3-methyladenine glycosylase family protein n=1 Tax=Halobaculum sp. MBLA0147 TaxID=3079934 RepID=UPI0035236F89
MRDDEVLGNVVEQHGPLALDPADDPFERLLVSICRQQVSTASAAATRERLFAAVEPEPAAVRATDREVLRDAGLSRQKARYVHEIAAAFADPDCDLDALDEASNETIRERLTAITGVGEWTANMQLLFSYGRPDVFPVGDLGIRKGARAVFDDLDADTERATIRDRAERWAPYRSYASLYLWQLVD